VSIIFYMICLVTTTPTAATAAASTRITSALFR